MERRLIQGATIVNEGCIERGSLLIEGDRIADIISEKDIEDVAKRYEDAELIEANGMLLMPGVVDTHVHFRDGGKSENEAGSFYSESRAAYSGGVTSIIDMPNTNPQTTNLDSLYIKEDLAARESAVNYGFMLGATNDNISSLLDIDPKRFAAIKLFLGSSTGNMLVNDSANLDLLFKESQKLIVAHCEDENIIKANNNAFRLQYEGTTEEHARLHPQIRNVEACYLSTYHAIERAHKYHTRLHIAHISTATELNLLSNFDIDKKYITAEVTPNHLWFDSDDYEEYGNLIKCNPAIKSKDDRLGLWAAMVDGLIDTIGSDHAPHTWAAKSKPYFSAPSGIPSVQFSLQMMLEGVFNPMCRNDKSLQEKWLPLIVEKMCHNPALLFGIEDRGFIRKGYKADLVLVNPNEEQTISKQMIRSKCGWSPLEGKTFHTTIKQVFINGSPTGKAEALTFNK